MRDNNADAYLDISRLREYKHRWAGTPKQKIHNESYKHNAPTDEKYNTRISSQYSQFEKKKQEKENKNRLYTTR